MFCVLESGQGAQGTPHSGQAWRDRFADTVSGHVPRLPLLPWSPGLSPFRASMFLAGHLLIPVHLPGVCPSTSAPSAAPQLPVSGSAPSFAWAGVSSGLSGLGAGLDFTITGVQDMPPAFTSSDLTICHGAPSARLKDVPSQACWEARILAPYDPVGVLVASVWPRTLMG